MSEYANWTPTDENIEKLPAPVRDYVRHLESMVMESTGELVTMRLKLDEAIDSARAVVG